jgi:hypothetical protein
MEVETLRSVDEKNVLTASTTCIMKRLVKMVTHDDADEAENDRSGRKKKKKKKLKEK